MTDGISLRRELTLWHSEAKSDGVYAINHAPVAAAIPNPPGNSIFQLIKSLASAANQRLSRRLRQSQRYRF